MADELSKLEELTLVLLHQTASPDEHGSPIPIRSWKGYDFQVMNRLHERGLVSDPARRARPAYLTEEGRKQAEALLSVYLGDAPPALLPPTCECGCGEETSSRGAFRPGHDQRLRAALESRVGGLLALRALVDSAEGYSSGRMSAEDLTREVRALWNERLRRAGSAPEGTKGSAKPAGGRGLADPARLDGES